MTTRILIVEDHQMFREGLCGLLAERDDLEVVGEAGDGRTAVEAADRLQPEIVIMDINLPELNGIEATRQIVAADQQVKVIALSMHTNKRSVVEVFRAGAVGFVSKLAAFDEVLNAVEACLNNQRFISSTVAALVVDALQQPDEADSAYGLLTPREREVLQLLAEGQSSKEVAADLGISIRTADIHRKNVMDKLGLETPVDVVRYAVREGIVTID